MNEANGVGAGWDLIVYVDTVLIPWENLNAMHSGTEELVLPERMTSAMALLTQPGCGEG